MSRYIKVEDAIETAINGCASWDGGYFPSMDEPIKEEFEAVYDKCIEIVRCKDCKHWERDVVFSDGWCRGKHQGNPDWFCADGERREE